MQPAGIVMCKSERAVHEPTYHLIGPRFESRISLYKLSLTLIVFLCEFVISIGFRNFCRGFTVGVTAFTRVSLKT